MTVDPRRVVVAAIAVATIGVVLRLRFVDLLTRTTGTWIGGVESAHRTSTDGTSSESSAG